MTAIQEARRLMTQGKASEAALILDRYLEKYPNQKKSRRILTAIRKCYLTIDEDNALFDPKGMQYREFYSDFNQVRFLAIILTQHLPPQIQERRLLEQQVSEIIKNAIRHGNKGRLRKKIRVWYEFEPKIRFIVADEGLGMSNMESWNEFNRRRRKAVRENDMETLMEFATYQTDHSDPHDGGNSLFAALQFWDEGLMYNKQRNKVVAVKGY
jgi:serine/threonine-protein kinase RsbW